MALLPMAIITLFWKDQIGLSLAEILLLQAIFSLATLVMEFPSGYISDRIGYRFALNLACLLGITGWATYTLAGSFTGVLIAELQLGASYAFISGADSALLYETLRYDGREEHYAKYDGRMTAWAQAGEAIGAVGAGVLYGWFPLLPFILQVGVWVAALAICRNLKDIPAPPRETISHLQEAADIARKAFSQPGIRYTILLAALLGLSSFYPVWLIQPYMQTLNVPLSWFGPIWAVANLCVSFGSIISHRVQFHLGARGTPLLLLALVARRVRRAGFQPGHMGFCLLFSPDHHARHPGAVSAPGTAKTKRSSRTGQHPVTQIAGLPSGVRHHRPIGRRSGRSIRLEPLLPGPDDHPAPSDRPDAATVPQTFRDFPGSLVRPVGI